MILRLFFILSAISPALNAGNDSSNVLIQGDTVQVSAEINISLDLQANQNIPVSVMVTHHKNTAVDNNSFKIGNKNLIANFVQNVSMPSNKDVIVSVYKTLLEGMPAGNHILPPISVRVEGKEYQTPPITVIINAPGT